MTAVPWSIVFATASLTIYMPVNSIMTLDNAVGVKPVITRGAERARKRDERGRGGWREAVNTMDEAALATVDPSSAKINFDRLWFTFRQVNLPPYCLRRCY